MKNNITLIVMGVALSHITKEAVNTAKMKKDMLKEYQQIMSNAKDIGKHNQLLSAYAMGAWFIAMNRVNQLSPDKNCEIMIKGFRRSRIFHIVMGNADHYLSPKRIKKQKKWVDYTHQRIYENDWVVNLLYGTKEYDLGYDYLECGICKLCHDEGCIHLAKYLCQLDYLFAEIMGLRLERTTTIAEGGQKCDFRFSRKKL